MSQRVDNQLMKPQRVFDSEVYVNYYLAQFLDILTGEIFSFEMFEGHPLEIGVIECILDESETISFNGNHFDMPLLTMALTGSTCAQIKEACDLIIKGGLKAWDVERKYKIAIPKYDHIDLIEVAPGFCSLKIYGGRMHTRVMQDLPIAPEDTILPTDHLRLREYCLNDLEITAELFAKLKPQIDLRRAMSEQYGIDLRSKSDAQIAETVIVRDVEKKKNTRIGKQTYPSGTVFAYKAPAWVRFHHPDLQQVLADIHAAEFPLMSTGNIKMPPALQDRTVALGESVYRLGIGGLHSSEESVAHVSCEEFSLRDRDVASYYPNIILQCGLAPKQMGSAFQEVYASILKRRLTAKAAGDTVVAEVLKIACNGSFGKLGSKYSVMFAPDLFLQVTITGQLALLMLIEQFEANGIPVISANTDGVVVKLTAGKEQLYSWLVFEWENLTGFVTEETRYSALYSRDVNNYIAVKTDGKVKLKGAYAPASLAKTPDAQVCIDAVLAYLKEGTPIYTTVQRCNDIRKFLMVRQVKGGAIKNGEYLGRAVRWYYARDESGAIVYKENGNRVAGSEGGRPCQVLPAKLPGDIDYARYTHDATQMLKDVGAGNTKNIASQKALI